MSWLTRDGGYKGRDKDVARRGALLLGNRFVVAEDVKNEEPRTV